MSHFAADVVLVTLSHISPHVDPFRLQSLPAKGR